jgi:hypothetical protein
MHQGPSYAKVVHNEANLRVGYSATRSSCLGHVGSLNNSRRWMRRAYEYTPLARQASRMVVSFKPLSQALSVSNFRYTRRDHLQRYGSAAAPAFLDADRAENTPGSWHRNLAIEQLRQTEIRQRLHAFDLATQGGRTRTTFRRDCDHALRRRSKRRPLKEPLQPRPPTKG